jgi:hypothetical protein
MITKIGPGNLRARSRGLTLTEILISIMIMGVGVLSLLTLFPLGIMRMAQAARSARSAILSESATCDLSGRGLMSKPSFFATWYGPPTRPFFDPFLLDPANPSNAQAPFADGGAFRQFGAGLPVAYDPLWWYELEVQTSGAVNPRDVAARFGSGIGFLRDDAAGTPSAHGLQRLTNFILPQSPSLEPNVERIFASTDDVVNQTEGNADPSRGFGNTIVPDMSGGAPVVDMMFTWMFTGRQTDLGNALVFDGDVVVFHNRPFALDTVNGPFANGILKPAGETVVEAIWGYGPGVQDPTYTSTYYALNSTSVLLRWPAGTLDPDVRESGWIADVTYERYQSDAITRYGVARDPAQRCHWYRVIRRSPTADDPEVAGFKRMVVTVDRPLRAQTPLSGANSTLAARVEAALVSPYVVNVFPKVFIVH